MRIPRLLELREQRGALRARCALQRQSVAAHAGAVRQLCDAADQVRAGAAWLRQHPQVVGGAVALLVLLKPSRLWRWGRRGLVAWQTWRSLRSRLFSG
ncbi:YqjK-like family protein [Azovibrio restrictus]|uniref:YqjK-like family protein n=1 Tax=Azovibrio restrictus TaxID=146938 RepID=UPI0026EFF34B|nr:YqjK-like family protein [Azovibrio restrictus]